MDGDGFLGREDLRQLLAMTVGKAVTPAAVDDIIDRTLRDADADGDGRLSYEDFEQVRPRWRSRGVAAAGGGRAHRRAHCCSPHATSPPTHLPTPPRTHTHPVQSTSALSWEQFTVPVKSSTRWELQEALQASNAASRIAGE